MLNLKIDGLDLIKKYWYVVMVLFAVFMFTIPVVCALILGGIIAFVSVEGVLFLNKVQKGGIQTQGEILGFESDEDGYKTPIIKFKTKDGDIIEGSPYVGVSTSLSKFRKYENKMHVPVPILFIPDHPKKFVVVSNEGYNYATLIFFIAAGTLLIVLGVCQLVGIINLF